MQHFPRIILTGVIWMMLGAIAITAVLNSQYSNLDPNAIAIAAMVMGAITTGLLWSSGSKEEKTDPKRGHFVTIGGDTKAKRGQDSTDARLTLLMEMMDEGELEAFKERLKRQILDEAYVTEDGEISYRGTSMNNFLDEAESVQYRRR